MSMKINYNVSAIIANNSLKINDNKLTKSLGKLSSGYKINSAKDDAAGLAISRRMNAQIKGLKAAEQDSKDGISVIEIADGALAEVQDILQRMNELSIKASTGTITDDDRSFIQQEIVSLAEEVDRIGNTTEFNGQQLFTGDFDLKGYTDDPLTKVDYYSDSLGAGKYEITIGELGYTVDEAGDTVLTTVGGSTDCKVKVKNPNDEELYYKITGDEYHLKLTGDDGDEITLDIASYGINRPDDAEKGDSFSKTINANPMNIDITGYGAMTFQIGANEGQTVDIRFQKLSMESLGFKNQDTDSSKKMILDVTTEANARKGIGIVKEAISTVSSMRSKLGAYQNRLEHTQSNLTTSDENMTAAYSRIMDTDMSEEMTNYSNLQIITQAATSILAQANERPSQMLQLLQ